MRTLSWIVGRRAALTAAIVGVVAVAASLLLPAESALAEVRRIRVGNTPVTVTEINSHNWGSLSPSNVDTVTLHDGSRGSYWSFAIRPGQCIQMAMRSDEFAPYLSLRTGAPDGTTVVRQASTGDFAQITLMNANGGTYYLLASSSGGGDQRGRYTLDISSC